MVKKCGSLTDSQTDLVLKLIKIKMAHEENGGASVGVAVIAKHSGVSKHLVTKLMKLLKKDDTIGMKL
jgi:DNA-binding IscR family transcriptional regulator